jgi:hypothetical protein
MFKDLILDSYKKSVSLKEILEAFVKSPQSESLLVWQKHHDNRSIIWAKSWDLNHNQERVVVFLDEKSAQLIDEKSPVYIKLPFREAVLKTTIEVHSKGCYFLKIPTEIFWREFRETPRLVFEYGERDAEIRSSQIPSRSESSSSMNTFRVFVKDISPKGMALLIPESYYQFLNSNRQIEFLSIDGRLMLSPKPAQLVYFQKEKKVQSMKGTWYRAGVKLLRPLSEEFIANLQKSDSLILKSLTIDCFSDDFKSVVDREVDVTLKKIKKNPALSKYLDQIEISRREDLYIEEHIKVLCIVCSFIARAMNWVTDLSLQKLIYVSYLHDAPLLNVPKLTKIFNLKEFEKLKSSLTPDEQKLFLSAPEKAFAIALADNTAPPDAPQILLMQKELPDGSGFPRRLNAQKITPLACIFIVGHDLTNEIMSRKDWSLEAWLLQAKPVYKAGQFIKIIETLENSKHLFKRR